MAYHFKNLVFEGGGVKGIAYVGALEVLDREGILNDIEKVSGTSAGAMIAVMVGLRYSADEVKEILWKLNFKNFMDSSFGMLRDTTRLIKEYGWYKGDFFRDVMADLIQRKTGDRQPEQIQGHLLGRHRSVNRLLQNVQQLSHTKDEGGGCGPYIHVYSIVLCFSERC